MLTLLCVLCIFLNSCSPKPALLNFESEHARIQYFTTENRMLHEQLDRAKHALTAAENRIQQLETRFMQTLTAVSADSASTSATRRPSKWVLCLGVK